MSGVEDAGSPKDKCTAYKHGARSAAKLDALSTVRSLGRLLDDLEA